MRRTALLIPVTLALLAVAAAAADSILPMHLVKAQVGEWTVMQKLSGAGAGELIRYRIVDRSGDGDDAAMTVRREVLGDDGEPVDMRSIDISIPRYVERMAGLEENAKQIGRERMSVKDKEITTFTATWESEDEEAGVREFKIWLSDDIPVGGMVKFWCSDPLFPSSELVDYGTN